MPDSINKSSVVAPTAAPPEPSTVETDLPIESPNEPPQVDSKIDVGDVADLIMGDAPPVSPHFEEIADSGGTLGGTPDSEAASAPSDNGAFDPAIHRVDKDGNPVRTVNGGYARKPGRKKGKTYDASGSTVGGAKSTPMVDAAQNAHNGAKAAAIVTVHQVEVVGRMIGGEEWAYIKSDEHGIDERAQGVDAFTAYFEANGVIDIPPGVALVLWGIGYAAPRFTMPRTKSRARLVKAWIGEKFSRLFGRKRKGANRGGSEKKESTPENGETSAS